MAQRKKQLSPEWDLHHVLRVLGCSPALQGGTLAPVELNYGLVCSPARDDGVALCQYLIDREPEIWGSILANINDAACPLQ